MFLRIASSTRNVAIINQFITSSNYDILILFGNLRCTITMLIMELFTVSVQYIRHFRIRVIIIIRSVIRSVINRRLIRQPVLASSIINFNARLYIIAINVETNASAVIFNRPGFHNYTTTNQLFIIINRSYTIQNMVISLIDIIINHVLERQHTCYIHITSARDQILLIGIFASELEKAHMNDHVGQYFAVLTDTQLGRGAQEYCLALRAINTDDFATAKWTRLPYELLDRISATIVRDVPGINRVVYDITSKPPATIEWQ